MCRVHKHSDVTLYWFDAVLDLGSCMVFFCILMNEKKLQQYSLYNNAKRVTSNVPCKSPDFIFKFFNVRDNLNGFCPKMSVTFIQI